MVEKLNGMPEAYAEIMGSENYPDLHGMIYFFEVYGGSIVMAEIYGLPDEEMQYLGKFFGFSITEGVRCTGDSAEPFASAGLHYNPENQEHPNHAGDLPLLLSSHGAAWSAAYTGRFFPDDVVGRTVIIYAQPDDYRSQPSGNSGAAIACGEIKEWVQQPSVEE